jgi:hypothetical protein
MENPFSLGRRCLPGFTFMRNANAAIDKGPEVRADVGFVASRLAFSGHCFGWNTADDSTVSLELKATATTGP